MKLNTIDHPKTLDLCDRLGVSLAQALGHLTLLWAFTARKSPRGDVGKWTDGAIARACDWQQDSAAFVNALVESGYLDRDDEHRLLVHDWPDHAERWVKASLKNLNQTFIVRTTEPTTVATTEATKDDTPCPALSCPDQPKAGTRKRALPPDFVPNETHEKLAAQKGVNLDAELEQFRDYHTAKGSTMKDWDAALRTWLRNAKKFGGAASAPADKPKRPKTIDTMNETELAQECRKRGINDNGMGVIEMRRALKWESA